MSLGISGFQLISLYDFHSLALHAFGTYRAKFLFCWMVSGGLNVRELHVQVLAIFSSLAFSLRAYGPNPILVQVDAVFSHLSCSCTVEPFTGK